MAEIRLQNPYMDETIKVKEDYKRILYIALNMQTQSKPSKIFKII